MPRSVQIDCTLDEAFVIMQERAEVQHQTVADVADGVLTRQIRFGV